MNAAPAVSKRGCGAWLAGCGALMAGGVLVVILLVALFYTEENWRGARAWKQTQADLEAQGETLDPAKFIPAPVPEAENFGTLPFFKEVSITYPGASMPSKTLAILQTLKPVTDQLPLSKDDGSKSGSLPYLGNWQKGETTDATGVTKQLETFLQQQKPGTPIPANATPADIFVLICPVLADLRAANATHPACRFEWDYSNPQPWKISLGATTNQIKLAQLLSYDERLALLSHEPDRALDDLQVAWKINSGLRQEPTLVSGLIATGVVAIQLGVVNQGLAEHAWSDQQLQTLDDDLAKMDYLSQSQFSLRSEAIAFFVPAMNHYSSHRSAWMKEKLAEDTMFGDEIPWKDRVLQVTYRLVPGGWFEKFKADGLRMLLSGVKWVDPTSRRVYPEREKNLTVPTGGLADIMGQEIGGELRPVLNVVRKYAYMQAQLDEARIACRLERYRLAHGSYPATLESLVPVYGPELPRDIMNGQAYIYKLKPDQTYILYSVGWNQKDDQGDAGTSRTSDSPDWIWTNYPNLSKRKD